MKKRLLALFFISVLFSSCGFFGSLDELRREARNDPDPVVDDGPAVTVYSAGVDNDGPCYWKNGVRVSLPLDEDESAAYSAVNAIAAAPDGTVYCAGFGRINGDDNAWYWINDVLYQIHSELSQEPWFEEDPRLIHEKSSINAIALGQNGPVFAGNYDGNFAGSVYHKAFYYSGETITRLATIDNGISHSVRAVTVNDDTVYAAGYKWESSSDSVCYWVGDNPQPVVLGSGDGANAIFVDDGTVYTAGNHYYYGVISCFWRNKTLVNLDQPEGTNQSNIYAIDVVDGTVYTAGYYTVSGSGEKACYWVDTEPMLMELPEGANRSWVQSVKLYDGTVYAAGIYTLDLFDCHICYWKNGKFHDLGPAGDNGWINASCIVINAD